MFRVDSVLAEIDASAAASSPTVTLADKSGQVIATKRQPGTIPVGDTGSAAWSLRLADDSGGAGGAGITFDTDNEGGYLQVGANGPPNADGNLLDFEAKAPGDARFGISNPNDAFAEGDVVILGGYDSKVHFRRGDVDPTAADDFAVLSDGALELLAGQDVNRVGILDMRTGGRTGGIAADAPCRILGARIDGTQPPNIGPPFISPYRVGDIMIDALNGGYWACVDAANPQVWKHVAAV